VTEEMIAWSLGEEEDQAARPSVDWTPNPTALTGGR
jgi:hypothetical protein